MPKIKQTLALQKITFVGGEPTLCPYLGELLEVGSMLIDYVYCVQRHWIDRGILHNWHHCIDWIEFPSMFKRCAAR